MLEVEDAIAVACGGGGPGRVLPAGAGLACQNQTAAALGRGLDLTARLHGRGGLPHDVACSGGRGAQPGHLAPQVLQLREGLERQADRGAVLVGGHETEGALLEWRGSIGGGVPLAEDHPVDARQTGRAALQELPLAVGDVRREGP